MKHITIFITLLLLSVNLYSQESFNCIEKEICKYKTQTKSYLDCEKIIQKTNVLIDNNKKTISFLSDKNINLIFFIKEMDDKTPNLKKYKVVDPQNGNIHQCTFDILKREISIFQENPIEINNLRTTYFFN